MFESNPPKTEELDRAGTEVSGLSVGVRFLPRSVDRSSLVRPHQIVAASRV